MNLSERDPNSNDLASLIAIEFFRPKIRFRFGKKCAKIREIRIYLLFDNYGPLFIF